MSDFDLIARPWKPQDLIDDLQGIIDEEPDTYLNTRRTTLCMERDFLKEFFSCGEWISVKDRLPPLDVDVLLYFGDEHTNRMAVGAKYWESEGWCSIIDGEYYTDCEMPPICWMPLPEPPKEDNNA